MPCMKIGNKRLNWFWAEISSVGRCQEIYFDIIQNSFTPNVKTFNKTLTSHCFTKIAANKHLQAGHLDHLRQSFIRMREYGLKMNPLKCAFCVRIRDFMGFVVHKKGIEINQNKTKEILNTKAPTMTK